VELVDATVSTRMGSLKSAPVMIWPSRINWRSGTYPTSIVRTFNNGTGHRFDRRLTATLLKLFVKSGQKEKPHLSCLNSIEQGAWSKEPKPITRETRNA
jgi:hypothetical protein